MPLKVEGDGKGGDGNMSMNENNIDDYIQSPMKELCHELKQKFIDCMHVYSRCVQSGAYSLEKCMEREKGNTHPECIKRFREFVQCRRQLVLILFN